ncbi:peptidylprolyl isomerase [Acidovorax sp. HMWF029]|uniref:peptidylprolyl isomerase n=1 Tax=Acidovorax sp. HMWF029 TaxID=2056863 RepID=UPI001E5C70F5|nr:peptidylprolyl isomerase [Acidovorax sp. HMWF029]
MNRCFSVQIRHAAAVTATAALVLCATTAQAADPAAAALIQGESVAITVQDMQADSLRMPPEMRSVVLQKTETVMQVASNLYARRVFAERAAAEGLDKNPQVAAALKVARDKVLSDAMLEHIDKKAVPSDAAVEALARNIYRAKPDRFKADEEVKIRHILLAEKTPESRAKAEQVLDELKKGADFAALAKERSADTGSAAKGGELGYFTKGRMVPEFETAAFALSKPGEISGLVETKFGYHILQLDDRRPPRTRAFEEVREELMKEVRTTAAQDARVAEAQKIQQGAKINHEAIDAFAASYKAAK